MKIILILIIMLFSISSYSQIELNDDNAKSKLIINNDKLIVVFFYATWSGPCQRMKPILKDLVKEYGDKVSFYKIDVDKNKSDEGLGITSTPAYLFLKNSNKKGLEFRAMSKQRMKDLVDSYLD